MNHIVLQIRGTPLLKQIIRNTVTYLSPKTGYPGKNKQIGIVTKEAFVGDIISTGLYNQSP